MSEKFVDGGAHRRGDLWRPVWTERDHDRADWNGWEACFDDVATYEGWTRKVAAVLVQELELGPGDVVADLGCGTGRIAAHVAQHVGHVVAVDYSDTVLEVARARRSLPNVQYEQADLNELDPTAFEISKAYAVGALLYLDSEEVVLSLVQGFTDRGVSFGAVDLPDETMVDDLERPYDRSTYTHLEFGVDRLQRRFPLGRVVRTEFSEYAHGTRRFSFFVPASGGNARPARPPSGG